MGLPQACIFQTCLYSVADFDDLEERQMTYFKELRLQKAVSQWPSPTGFQSVLWYIERIFGVFVCPDVWKGVCWRG